MGGGEAGVGFFDADLVVDGRLLVFDVLFELLEGGGVGGGVVGAQDLDVSGRVLVRVMGGEGEGRRTRRSGGRSSSPRLHRRRTASGTSPSSCTHVSSKRCGDRCYETCWPFADGISADVIWVVLFLMKSWYLRCSCDDGEGEGGVSSWWCDVWRSSLTNLRRLLVTEARGSERQRLLRNFGPHVSKHLRITAQHGSRKPKCGKQCFPG